MGAGTTLINEHKKWYAIRTKFRAEKQVLAALSKKEIESYLPLLTKTRRYNKSVRKFSVPLISNYVFVTMQNIVDKIKILETEFVFDFVKQGKEIIPISDREMDILHRITGDVESIFTIEPLTLVPGDKVEITQGQLIGIQGTLVRKANSKQVVVELENLGYQLRINIEQHLLQKIEKIKA